MGNVLRIALAQINTVVGDLEGNKKKILAYLEEGKKAGADLVAFPELTITGYPPEDLLFKPQFIQDNLDCLQGIVGFTRGITAVVGFVDRNRKVYNAAAVLHDEKLAGVCHKICLPNYGVFDEKRYFVPGRKPLVFELDGIKIGVNICEDIWVPDGVTEAQVWGGGAQIIVNISSSPYHAGKGGQREEILSQRARDNGVFVAYVNLVGGQDELVFDGESLIFNGEGKLLARGKQFQEDLVVVDLNLEGVRRIHSRSPINKRMGKFKRSIRHLELNATPSLPKPPLATRLKRKLKALEEIYGALVLGLRDYVRKNGFQKVVIGLSGGIDSSLTAAIAVDALGKENVNGIFMPSRYSSPGSRRDAKELASNLGINLLTIPIEEVFKIYLRILQGPFKNLPQDVTEENLQARIRGIILMALSNKFGWLVLATGNKSELAVGYCTLYGDMVGGFAVIKDVPKTLVYKLAEYRNSLEGKKIIPHTIIEKEPSAELKTDQRDQDSLPPYETLDSILEAYVEKDKSIEEIVALGYGEEVVKGVAQMVDRNEYKRRQGPPGIKITPRAFGKDRRMPITNHYQD